MRGFFFRTLILLITTTIFFGCSILNNVNNETAYNYKNYFGKEPFLKQIKMPEKIQFNTINIIIAAHFFKITIGQVTYLRMCIIYRRPATVRQSDLTWRKHILRMSGLEFRPAVIRFFVSMRRIMTIIHAH